MRDEAFASNGGKKKKMTLTQKGKPVQRYLQSEGKTFFKLILVSLED